MDNYRERAVESSQVESDIPELVLAEFRAMLLAFGQCADQAVPSLGIELTPKMTCLQQTLAPPVSADFLIKANQEARAELLLWADRAFAHNQDVARELREIISVVSEAAGSLSDRDAKHAREIGDLSGRLGSIALEKDLLRMRRSVFESARALKECVARMTEDSKASVEHLTAEVRAYRTRLEEAERVSQTDPLTNLANRWAFEKHLEARVAARNPFCLIMADLNGFKSVNDRLGHIAGDELLRKFAMKLKSLFTPAEMVCRWGGDEFVVVVTGHLSDAQVWIERVRKGTLCEYEITQGDQRVKIPLKAALGVAEWDGNETGLDLLARADQKVYWAKEPGGRRRALADEGVL